jgi:nucleoside-diphosphate-sugar epimerase
VVLVTGANGFVGRALCPTLKSAGYTVRRAVRRDDGEPDTFAVGDIGPTADWMPALDGVDVVVHLAAHVHVMNEASKELFHQVNVAGTERLARQAAAAGARRLVYMSSIKANGERTPPGQPFTEETPPNPQDPYGISKWEAEKLLHSIDDLDAVTIRPPLVYGPGALGNFAQLLRWVARGWPLPLANARNRRSFVGIDNLCDFVTCCLDHPDAAEQTFLISDGHDLSTAELIRHLAKALDKPARLFPFPVSVMQLMARLVGRQGITDRLFGSLTVNADKARSRLGWTPPLSVDEGLARVAAWYLGTEGM